MSYLVFTVVMASFVRTDSETGNIYETTYPICSFSRGTNKPIKTLKLQ